MTFRYAGTSSVTVPAYADDKLRHFKIPATDPVTVTEWDNEDGTGSHHLCLERVKTERMSLPGDYVFKHGYFLVTENFKIESGPGSQGRYSFNVSLLQFFVSPNFWSRILKMSERTSSRQPRNTLVSRSCADGTLRRRRSSSLTKPRR